MKRKNQWLLFAILLLALINLSPSENSTLIRQNDPRENEPEVLPNEVAVQEAGQIKVYVQLSEYDFARLQQMNRQFMADHPVEVELVNIPANDNYAELKQQLELGESPDVLLLDNTWVRSFAVDGYLMPTENYYSGSLTGEVLSASLAQNEWNGYMWGVPLDVDPYVWIYNPAQFKSFYGSDFPATKKEWTEFVDKYLTAGNELPHELLMFDFADPYASLSFIWQLGGQAEQGNSSPFQKNKSVESAIQQSDRLRPFLVNINEEAASGNPVWDKLKKGEIAAALVRYTEASKNFGSQMKMVIPSSDEAAETMWISGRSYAVSARSDNKEAAGLWISEMTSQQKQRQWFEMTDYLPVYKSMYYQASRNGLPNDIPASLINDKKSSIPVGASLPSQMKQFSELSSIFYNNEISSSQFLDDIYKIAE